jgi:succinyl-diaminopimelate desuccinylase
MASRLPAFPRAEAGLLHRDDHRPTPSLLQRPEAFAGRFTFKIYFPGPAAIPNFVNTDSFLAGAEHDLCRFLADLIRIDTSNPPGRNYLGCVHFLDKKLQALGFKTKIHRVPNSVLRPTLPDCEKYPRYSVIGRWNVGASQTVHFNAHYDVVPAGHGWKTPPFEPSIRKGWFYGRGSNDMKGSIAALLFAIEALQKCKQRPKVNIEIAFVPDEESNSLLGTGYIVDKKLVKADYAVVCEGGWENVVGCGHNGVLWMEVTVKGKSAHASRPHLGINAFEQAAALCMELQHYKAKQREHVFIAPGGAELRPPLTLGGEIRTGSGSKINTIPDHVTFTVDRRILPDETEVQVERELRAFLREATRKIPQLKIDIRKISSRKPSLVPEDNPLPQGFLRAVKKYRRNAGFGMTSGFTDMSFYANEAGIPTVGYGVAGKNTHGVDECVSIRDLMTTSKIYARFLTEWEG